MFGDHFLSSHVFKLRSTSHPLRVYRASRRQLRLALCCSTTQGYPTLGSSSVFAVFLVCSQHFYGRTSQKYKPPLSGLFTREATRLRFWLNRDSQTVTLRMLNCRVGGSLDKTQSCMSLTIQKARSQLLPKALARRLQLLTLRSLPRSGARERLVLRSVLYQH